MWRPTYRVELLDSTDAETGNEYVVKVMHGDQLRAELEAGRRAIIPGSQPFALTSLWVWAAMSRLHLTELDWTTWTGLVAQLDRVPEPEPEDGGEDTSLDPTPAALTASP